MKQPEKLPKLHPRRKIVSRVEAEIFELLVEPLAKLTPSEAFLVLSNQISYLAKSCISCEREDDES